MVDKNLYQGFPKSFLKNLIKNSDGEKINVGDEDFYSVIGMDEGQINNVLGKKNNDSVNGITFRFKVGIDPLTGADK